MGGLQKLSVKHDAIMQWLIANPQLSLSTCALQFNITQAWLSTIIHSDIFQSKYKELLQGQYDERILPLRDKLVGVTARALDRVSEKLDTCEDAELLLDVANKGLKALGFGSGPKVAIQNNFGAPPTRSAVTPGELASARQAYDEHCKKNTENLHKGQVIEGELADADAAST